MNPPRARTKGQKGHEKLLAMLLTHPSLDEAARACGISRSTSLRIRKDPGFKQQLREAQEQLVQGALEEAHNGALDFIRTLREICLDTECQASARVQAGRSGIESLLRLVEHADILRRMEALEKKAESTQ